MITHPFTQEEYIQLCEIILPIKEFIPSNHLDFIWNSYLKIEAKRESRPCSCGSAAGLWKKAVEVNKEFIKRVQETNK